MPEQLSACWKHFFSRGVPDSAQKAYHAPRQAPEADTRPAALP
ncbi:Uncharacterized protein pbN1_12710 [Aromatoleum bremense]|nr:Uncharacterized protein pbN1_12710 [Aromatoleum bremense]